ncbi:MAG: Two-component response regulator [Candidatus Tokpelaia sp. JSC085]|nr:MAG: Two-component response regulator [Candidatus Tokpelaia sp. JSC085]
MLRRTILIVDDDDVLCRILVEQLQLYEMFHILTEKNARNTLKTVQRQNIDLIVMDVCLPDMDGREVVKILRHNGFRAPVIMLTGSETDSDTILGLEAGANDYVTKPFHFFILLARIHAQLRQYEQNENATFQIGPYIFKPGQKLLISVNEADENHNIIRLTEKEAAIIQYLHRAGSNVVSRDTLLERVWGYNSGVTTHTLETHVYRLRRKIEKDPSNAQILVTENRGYKLVS